MKPRHPLGIVSISFRPLAPRDLLARAAAAGLECIEWGSDAHAPPRLPDGESRDAALERLSTLARATREAGLAVSSYGTYFRLGATPPGDFPALLEAARALGAPILRVWAGARGFSEMDGAERAGLLRAAREATARAADAGIVLCLECHPNTATDCPEGSAFLLEGVPGLATYWQPNPFHDEAWNLAHLRLVAPRVKIAHVFHWIADETRTVRRHPLAEGTGPWTRYLADLPPAVPLLLEFMPDDSPDSLPREAGALRTLSTCRP
ncbi:MAG: sugar phosphate isomerase/epimerase family protein [Kiritimatiellia bacterium]|jgi:3-dehydroshikimate dehydratase